MSDRHEDRARKLHARLTAAMHTEGGTRKHSVADVAQLEVSVFGSGQITVAFRYSDGTESTIDFAPGTNAYDMAREAKRHAVGRCSEIREARETSALSRVEIVTEESAAAYNAEIFAAKNRLIDALLQHRAAERTVEEVDGRRGVHVKCSGCDFGTFSPYREDQADVAAFLDKARTAEFPADDLDRAFAEHQAAVVARLL